MDFSKLNDSPMFRQQVMFCLFFHPYNIYHKIVIIISLEKNIYIKEQNWCYVDTFLLRNVVYLHGLYIR